MSKIYHIKPKDNRKKQKEPLWKMMQTNHIINITFKNDTKGY